MILRSRSGPGSGNGPALPELHRRLRWVALSALARVRAAVGRLWQLQVMRGDSYYERTVSNVVKERYLPSVRGKILDRKGVPLADNRPAFNIYATPKTADRRRRAPSSSRMLGLSDDEIAKIDERLAVGKKRDPEGAGARARGSGPRSRRARRAGAARGCPASRSTTSRTATTRRATSRRTSSAT